MAPGVVVVEEEEGEQQQGAPPRRPQLAVEALRDKIVEKVKANRVTLIVGDTGCGNLRGFPCSHSLLDWLYCACRCCAFLCLWGFVVACERSIFLDFIPWTFFLSSFCYGLLLLADRWFF